MLHNILIKDYVYGQIIIRIKLFKYKQYEQCTRINQVTINFWFKIVKCIILFYSHQKLS